MSKTIYYSIHRGDLTDEGMFGDAVQKIVDVLNDPNGWAKYGYKFIHINDDYVVPGLLNMYFKTNANMIKSFGYRIARLSCYVPAEHAIYFNIENWNGGSASTLSVDRYRTYVVNHEVGHALGLDHAKCPQESCAINPSHPNASSGCKGSVMQQMSKGPSHVYPCVENEYPLDPEYFDEFQTSIQINGGDADAEVNPYLLPTLFGFFGGCMMLLSAV